MSRSVEQMIDDVIRREGGYVHHPRDRGGPTNFGITQTTLARHLGRPASADDVRRLSRKIATDIYRRDYYEASGIERLPARIQAFVFDAAVRRWEPMPPSPLIATTDVPRSPSFAIRRCMTSIGIGFDVLSYSLQYPQSILQRRIGMIWTRRGCSVSTNPLANWL